MLQSGTRPQMTIWRMRFACRIIEATNTHLEQVILIVFPPQQLLYEHVSVLRCMYIACLVVIWRRIENKALCISFLEQSDFHTIQLIIWKYNLLSVIHETYLLYGFACCCVFVFLLSTALQHLNRFLVSFLIT